MKKKIFPLIFTLILTICFTIPANAYQINDYKMHHEAGMMVYLDSNNGDTVIYEKNADKRMYPASITKLMSAIVMVENIPDLENTKITYSEYANNQVLGTGSVVLGLKVGEQISAKDALAALLVSSCGDISYAIAEHVGGSSEGFVKMMNEKAKELGLTGTNFVNASGLHHDNHYSTARDIYKLAVAAFKYDVIKTFSSKSRAVLSPTNMAGERTIVTSNFMLNPNAVGYYKYAGAGKTGYTEKAGRCIVSTAKYKGYEYLVVVLNADTSDGIRHDFGDAANMFRWAFNNFEYKSVFDSVTPIAEAPLTLSKDFDHLPICFQGGLKAILPKDADTSTIDYKINLDKELYKAPVKKGDKVGTADIYYAEEKIGTINLVAGQSIDSSAALVFLDAAKNFLTSSFMKVIYVLAAITVIVFLSAVIVLNKGKKKQRKVRYMPITKEERSEWDRK